MELWELAARERIRDTLAGYIWLSDAGRLEKLTLAFCEDGVLQVRGQEPLRGRAAIVGMLGGVSSRLAASSGTTWPTSGSPG